MMVHNFPNIRKIADRDLVVGIRPCCRIKMVPLYGRNHSSDTGVKFSNEHSTWRSQLLCKRVRKAATPIKETDDAMWAGRTTHHMSEAQFPSGLQAL